MSEPIPAFTKACLRGAAGDVNKACVNTSKAKLCSGVTSGNTYAKECNVRLSVGSSEPTLYG